MKNIMTVLAALAALVVCAGERVALWPEGKMPDFQPHQVATMTDEAEKNGAKTNAAWRAAHQMPYVEWFEAPAKPNGGCMILVSGGSYQCCCDVGLIKMWREELTKLGFQCVNLAYRTPRPHGLEIYRSAWEDGQRAVRVVRADAAKRGFDPEKIGVIGMSAGGHLTMLLATSALTPAYPPVDQLDELPCHINWAVANAPAYNTKEGEKGGQTKAEGVTEVPEIGPSLKFDAKTCPISFHHGGKDPWTPNGSTLAYRELRKRNVPAELHLYADKSHGAHGFERAVEFMRQMGYLGAVDPDVRLNNRFTNDVARATYEKQDVWPEGKMPDVQTNQCTPYIEWHIPKKLTTKAIQIIYSGGGYNFNSIESFEVTPARRYLNEKGMAVVTMKYRTPRPEGLEKHVTAWQDLQRAIRLVRSQAEARGLDPNRIGIMGGSAGGHLTLMGALSSSRPAYAPVDGIDNLLCNVQWAVAVYPAYVLTDGIDSTNKHGGNLDEDALVPELAFDTGSCPVVFLHGDADGYAAMGSVKCWEKLRTMGVQCDLHTYATRKHCFQACAAPGTGSYTWLDRIWDFLDAKKFNK